MRWPGIHLPTERQLWGALFYAKARESASKGFGDVVKERLRGRCKVCQVMVGFGHAKTGEAGCAGSSASRHSSGNRAGGRLSGDQGDVSKRLNPEHARGLQSRREVSSQLVSPMGGHCPRTQRSVPDLAVMPQWGRTLFKSRAASLSSFGDGPKPDKHKHLRTSHSLKYQHVWLYARFPKP